MKPRRLGDMSTPTTAKRGSDLADSTKTDNEYFDQPQKKAMATIYYTEEARCTSDMQQATSTKHH